jgi:hypothetical protein
VTTHFRLENNEELKLAVFYQSTRRHTPQYLNFQKYPRYNLKYRKPRNGDKLVGRGLPVRRREGTIQAAGVKSLYSQGYRENYVLKIIIFWAFNPEDGGNKLFRNFGIYIPIYLTPYLRRLDSCE